MTTRRLAAILAADVAGFSAMMERDEEGTAARIRALRAEVIEPALARHHGRLVKTTGDGFLAEFASPVEAVRSALAIQDALAADVDGVNLRIGINLGDIIIEDDGDVLGDGVNVAARLEQIADAGGVAISGWVHDQIVGKIDRSFEDKGEQQVKNIARPVRVYAVAGSRSSAEPQTNALPLPDRPSIAVLPFTNMSGDPEQEHFADGVVEDLITALSRVKWFFVIARNSSFTYKGRAVDIRQVGHELGVRYVLEGSIRKAGNRVRITGQLIDAATGNHLWADRLDGSMDDIFELQDQMTALVVGAVEPRLAAAEIHIAAQKPTGSLVAYDLYQRAWACFRHAGEAGSGEALKLLERAVALDPNYASAFALAAYVRSFRVNQSWASEGERGEAVSLARRAIRLGSDDPTALASAAWSLSFLGSAHGEALDAIERSLSLNPNSAAAWNSAGYIRVYTGDWEEAVACFQRAMRLSPMDPELYRFRCGLAFAYVMGGQFEAAVREGAKALPLNSSWPTTHRVIASAHAHLGRIEEAQAMIDRLLEEEPGLTLSKLIARSPKCGPHGERYFEGLRLAGLPE